MYSCDNLGRYEEDQSVGVQQQAARGSRVRPPHKGTLATSTNLVSMFNPMQRPPTAPPTPDNSHEHAHSTQQQQTGWPSQPHFQPPPHFTQPPQDYAQQQQAFQRPAAGGPHLLNNLAQHLNNPGAPQPHTIQAQQQQQSSSATTGKLLILPNGQSPAPGSEEEKIYVLIAELLDPEGRETALLELSKKREMYEDLALVLWGGFGTSLLPA